MIRWYISIIASLFFSLAQAAELKVLIWSEELAPIVQWDRQSSSYKGILIDIFDALPNEHKIEFSFVLNNRIKGEFALYDGEADLSIFSREWMKHPEKLLYSEPIYVQREYLYAKSPIAATSINQIIQKKTICTRRGYVYRKLDPFFKAGKSSRMDSRFEITQFKMLQINRCDLAIADELVGEWIIEKNGWQDAIYRSKQVIDMIDFTIAFHPSKHQFLDMLNAHIRHLKNNGKLEHIIEQQRSSFKKGNLRFGMATSTQTAE